MSDHTPNKELNKIAGSDPSILTGLKNSPEESEVRQVMSSRRQAFKRFASYTAPAMIALISANEALATP
jgi:hypothetical protein